jgi:xylan 1,4-beta-xylosidase|eukprot:COSAG06_NODE_9137_length_1969_cov_5.297657_1_plen_90_part_00
MPASYARIVLTAATAAVASLLLSPSSAAAATQVSFEATLNGSTLLPFPHYWEECVGSGHMALGLRSDWQAHLKKVKDACGFRRIRGHGL